MLKVRSKQYIFFAFLLISLFITFVECNEDYYKILGVPRNADEGQIKKAFKKLSLKYHPDKNKDNEEFAKQQFVRVAKAYETLIDPEKKEVYDQYGEEGVKRKEQGGHPGGGMNFGGNFEDIFQSFFGGGFQGGGGQRFQFNFGGGRQQQHFHQQHHHQRRHEEPHEDFWQQSDVIQLSMESLSSFYRRNEVWIIFFYKSNDKASKAYKDVLREVAEKLYGIIKVAAINCHEEADDALCEDFMVYDIPKILVFPANIRAEPLTYNGAIQYGPIASFAVGQMESFVKLVTEGTYTSFVQEEFDRTKVILFTSKKVTPPLLRALSKEFKGRIVFGEVRESSASLINKFRITSFPTILVLGDPDNYSGVKYEGEFKKDQITKFLREHSSSSTLKRPNRGSTGELKELLPNMVRSGPCSPSDSNICLLAILSPKGGAENEQLKNILADLAPKYTNDPISFFFTSAANIEYASSFDGLSNFPSLFILKTKRGRYVRYEGNLDSEGVQTFVETVLSGSASFKNMKSQLTFTTYHINDEL